MTPQELKDSIIRLAMQGKLVEQRSNEGTARTLRVSIDADRKQKTQNKTAKENKKVEPITEDVIPFDIPNSWEWIRFGEMVSYSMGKTPPRAESEWWGNDFPWVSIADMPESGHITETKECVSLAAITEKFSGKIAQAGTLLMSFKLTVGRVSILDIDAVHNEAIVSIYPYADSDCTIQNYLFHLLPYISQFGDSKNAIKGKTLNDTSICNLLIPLPPLAEQKRIVAKIEELLPYIDRYEQAWSKLEDFNKRFPVDMQKSILQMAIQGKLVEQRPEEGTGEELYQQIQAEKKRLIKTGEIKKEKPLPEIAEEEIPFEIPESWKWVRLRSLGVFSSGKTPTMGVSENWDNGTVSWITSKDMKRKYLNSSEMLITEKAASGMKMYPANTILMVVRSGILKRILPVAILSAESTINQDIKAMSLHMPIIAEYAYVILKGMETHILKEYRKQVTTVDSLRFEDFQNMPVPLPPLAEQKRIVAKLEEILPLCERLK